MIFSLLLAVFMGFVIYYDTTRYIIPNWLVGIVLLLYPVFVMMSPTPIDGLMGLAMAACLLSGGFIFFAFNIMGAGDVKLMAALGLWVGFSMIGLQWVLMLSVLGGLLTIFLLGARLAAPWAANKLALKDLPKVLTGDAPVPYGIAIAGAFLIMLFMGDIPGLPALQELFVVT